MSYAVNLGGQKLLETGYPVTTSIMFSCPWYQQAVNILKNLTVATMSEHRQQELNALASHRFKEALEKDNITVVPFVRLIEEVGLEK